MLKLFSNEQVLLMMRRHWYVLAGPVAVFVVLLIVPSLVIAVAPVFLPQLGEPQFAAVVDFFLALYLMATLTYMLILWLSYYLDVWIITDQRIIDIEQHGLFHREISEIAMDKIQNVTIEVPGFIATILKFGNIRIQTAGEADFTISEVADFYHAKDIILAHSRPATARTRV